MGPALTALSDVATYLKHNPVILGVGFVSAVVTTVINVVPLVRVLNLLVAPLCVAGMLGTVHAGRNGDAGLDDFVDSVRDSYLPVLGGYVVFAFAMGASVMVAGFVSALFAFVLPLSSAGGGGMAADAASQVPGGTMLVGMGTVLLVVFLVGLAFMVFVAATAQLFDVAIVTEDLGVTGGFDRSWQLFKAAPASLLGYTLARGVISVLPVVVPVIVFGMLGIGLGFSGELAIAGLAAYLLVFVPLGFVVGQTYHVAYYNRLTAQV